MVQQLLQYTKGYVRIRVTGSSYERFLNMCAKHQIELWDLLEAHNAYEMNLSIRGFKTLRPLVKKSGTKVRIIERYSLFFAQTSGAESASLRSAVWRPVDDVFVWLYMGYPYRGEPGKDR